VTFPSWSAQPASPWNYAMSLRADKVDGDARFEQLDMTSDPWVHPPVRLKAPARRVPGWKQVADPKDPSVLFFPALRIKA